MPKNADYRSQYRILGQIGQGQFGQVYFAIRRQTGDLVALKSLRKGFPTNRFLREFSCLVSLRHPNIVSCQAIEYHSQGRYLVMDYCEGGTLRDLMNFSAPLSLELCLDLISDILAGLEEAHQQNIIHCDIKPENILLSLTAEKWIAKVTDFGIAKISQESVNNQLGRGYTGSPAYMAPERFYGKYSSGCDLYSVGIILYELIVGERPFSGLPSDLMLAHLNQRIRIPDRVPKPLKEIILKALEKLPQRRFSSAQEMLDAVNLAKNKLNKNYEKFILFLPKTPSFLPPKLNYLHPVNYSEKITSLVTDNKHIYLGINNHLIKLVYEHTKSTNILDKQEDIKLENPIENLRLCPQGCFVLTKKINPLNSNYYFYYFPKNNQDNDALNYRIFQQLDAEELKYTIDLQGQWLATVSQNDCSQITTKLNILKISNLSLINSPKPFPLPSQLITLDSRHGLAIFPRFSQGEKRTYIYLFNRRGLLIKGFSVPLLISELTANKTNPYELFGIESMEPHYGILIKLNPLQIKRIPLDFIPKFIVAEAWGYGLGNTAGKLILLDRDGEELGQMNLPITITAMTGLDKNQLLIAIWSDEQAKLLQLTICKKPLEILPH